MSYGPGREGRYWTGHKSVCLASHFRLLRGTAQSSAFMNHMATPPSPSSVEQGRAFDLGRDLGRVNPVQCGLV